MTGLALTILAASLVGSLHCAAMCGGLVAFYAGGIGGRRRASAACHAAYSAGRLATYASLGAVAGGAGAALDAAGAPWGLRHAAAALAGALIAVWGGVALCAALGVRVPRPPVPARLERLVARGIAAVAARPPAARALVMGLLTGCLPCGWLYAFAATAAGTGSPLGGAAVMAVFWLGTLPVMVSLGVGVTALVRPLQRYLPAACAVAMIAVGLVTVAGRLGEARAPDAAHGGPHHHSPFPEPR